MHLIINASEVINFLSVVLLH